MDEIHFPGLRHLVDRAKNPADARERLLWQIGFKAKVIVEFAKELNLPTLGDWLLNHGWAKPDTVLDQTGGVRPERAFHLRGIWSHQYGDPPHHERNLSEVPTETREVFWGLTKEGEWLLVRLRREVTRREDNIFAIILQADVEKKTLEEIATNVGQAFGIWDSIGLTLRDWCGKAEDRFVRLHRHLHEFNAESSAIRAMANI